MIRLVIVLLLVLYPVQANYCLCSDIQTQSLCQNSKNYSGTCFWDNGLCLEKNCEQRLTQSQCEANYGSYYSGCGWVDNSRCINPLSCSDIGVQKWCLRSGCYWVQRGDNSLNDLTTAGICTGPALNSISCGNLNADQCTKYGYFYNYGQDSYEKCYLDENNNCVAVKVCKLYSSETTCDPTRCSWNNDQQECEIKSCFSLKTSSECSAISTEDQSLKLCRWSDKNSMCFPIQCADITKDQHQCIYETVGLSGGSFCKWTLGKCTQTSCLDITDQKECQAHSFFDGGISTCTWLTDNDGGFCYTCNTPPLDKLVYSNFISLGLSFIILALMHF